MSVDAGAVFEFLAGVGKQLGGLLPGKAGVAARIVSAAMTTAAALESMGLDPEAEIVLMHSARPEVARARAHIDKIIAAKFYPPPPAGDGSDVYDEGSDHGQS